MSLTQFVVQNAIFIQIFFGEILKILQLVLLSVSVFRLKLSRHLRKRESFRKLQVASWRSIHLASSFSCNPPSISCPGGGMVDTEDLKSSSFGSTGSSPVLGTICILFSGSLLSLKSTINFFSLC
jgi:hypothetical protein